ncbi:MAG TPA: substrate-binding domain-containing protein [Acidimicrobiales bacterium]|nr:substrate-binding domain-containing protein [Acidimicrobiales bacterium]
MKQKKREPAVSIRGRRRIPAVGALTILAGLGLGSIGASPTNAATANVPSAASSGVATAKQLVAAAMADPSWTTPGAAFKASSARGDLVYDIANSLQLGFTQTLVAGTEAGLHAAGVKVVVVDNKADVSETARLIQQAIGQHAKAIIVQSQPASLISAPLKAAKAAHIPVIELFEGDPQLPPSSEQALGVYGEVTFCYSCGGKLLADWAIADTNGHVDGVTYWDSDVGASYAENQGERAEFARLSPTSHITFQNVLVADWATQIPTLTQSDLLNHAINYLLPNYDEMATYMIPSVEAASAAGRVKIASFNANADILKDLVDHDVVVADIGSPVGWMGWAVADQTLRALTGTAPVASENVPLRLFSAANIGSININKPESTWYGVNYPAKFEQLWGLG